MMVLRSYLVGSVELVNPSIATTDGWVNGTPFGLAYIYDLWMHVIPAPAAIPLAALGLCCLPRTTRRRTAPVRIHSPA